jgi:hypothetical protein
MAPSLKQHAQRRRRAIQHLPRQLSWSIKIAFSKACVDPLDFRAVAGEYLGAQVKAASFAKRNRRDWRATGAAKALKQPALGRNANMSRTMIDCLDQRLHLVVAGGDFDSDRSLRRRRKHVVEHCSNLRMPKPIEARRSQQRRVRLAKLQFAQPRRDIPSE